MLFTFIDMAGKTLFIREDAERAQWTTEEMTLDLEFPYLEDKAVSIGQRVVFNDPATGAQQIYEVKQARTYQPDAYQQITAEHICISELSDEHLDNKEITNQSLTTALGSVLTGTLWSIGETELNPVSSADISRGSVWQAVLQIKDNYNVYIEPRVTLNSDGSITRVLDVTNTGGVWRGVRLSLDKNLLDPCAVYDDSEVATALYGYGGTVSDPKDPDASKETDFTGIAWTQTADHPAKPMGQAYLEDPAATAEFGRNGRARFGFYQNSDITDPNTLLQKTWETLKTVMTPAISIEGTIADLYRMGYADQPLRLHDIALVEILPTGFKKEIQIIRMTVDLLDATASTLTIGSYIPNIIYIERKTNESATGSRGGGGGNKAEDTNEWREFRTTIEAYQDGTGMQIKAVQNDIKNTNEEVAIQSGRIEVCYNKITAEVIDRRDADNVLAGRIQVEKDRITAEVTRASKAEGDLAGQITIESDRITQEVTRATTEEGTLSGRITTTAEAITAEVTRATTAEGTLSGRITTTAEAITAEVTRATTAEGTMNGAITVNSNKVALVVSETQGGYEVNSASIVAGINGQTGSYVKIKADTINLSGYVTASQLDAVDARIDNLVSGQTAATQLTAAKVTTSAFRMAGSDISTKSKTVVTGVNFTDKTTTTESVYYLGWL